MKIVEAAKSKLTMSVTTDIAEARSLLEKAERESDPEQETHHIEEALGLLETVDDIFLIADSARANSRADLL